MATVWQASVEDLYRAEGKAELVGGEIRMMSPAGGKHGWASGKIFLSLFAYAQNNQLGFPFGDNVGFLVDLPDRKSFSPDAAFYTGPAPTHGFLPEAPVFAVEIRSPEDYGPTAEQRLAGKRADYFAAGTQVVWDVDLIGEDTIRVYRTEQPEVPTVYRRGETAEAEPAVPGWQFPVDELFV